jgi:hypothetical protein
MADNQDIKVVKNERGIGTGEARTGTTPRPNADGSLPPSSNARNPIVTDVGAQDEDRAPTHDEAGKTPGSAEAGGLDPAGRPGPGKTPGKAEG